MYNNIYIKLTINETVQKTKMFIIRKTKQNETFEKT